MTPRFALALLLVGILTTTGHGEQPQFEFENNWLMWCSFQTGQDEGIEGNLDDNFAWMLGQGYTHLRFFGIYPDGVHVFPSPTLDANGYPSSPLHETVLPILVDKAEQWGIVINFDGWETLAEANQDTTELGVGFLTSEEIGSVVREVLAFGVQQISDEQFGSSDLQAIQEATSEFGARHETTTIYWWPQPGVADELLSSVFCYYTYDQAELDSVLASTFPPSNLGHLHIHAESAQYYDLPFSIAVGSFGNLEAANWKNILLFSQIQHLPERFSVEEHDTSFTIWDSNFNFMEDIGAEILAFETLYCDDRPLANLVMDLSRIDSYGYYPAYQSGDVSVPAIVNTFTMLGYRVVATAASYLPEAELYYVMVAGGAGPTAVVELPDYVMPLLNGDKPVFLHPGFGIPDENDSPSWLPVRALFGLPAGDTDTLVDGIPAVVDYAGTPVHWGGVTLWLPPLMERIPSNEIDDTVAEVLLEHMIDGDDLALLVRNEHRFLVNSNVVHLDAAYIFADLLGGPLNAPATADIALTQDRLAILAEYDTDIDINLPWSGPTHLRRYNPRGELLLDIYCDLAGCYASNLDRGELVVLTAESGTAVVSEEEGTGLPFHGHRAYPNPFNGGTVIEYDLRTSTQVTLSIHDIRGRRLRLWSHPRQAAGHYSSSWDGRDQAGRTLASGIYFYRLSGGDQVSTGKLVLAK